MKQNIYRLLAFVWVAACTAMTASFAHKNIGAEVLNCSNVQTPPSTAATQQQSTKRFYRFVTLYNSVTMPSDNSQIDITFYNNGTFTAFNRTWTYRGKNSFGLEEWYSGNDYATIVNNRSSVTFYKQECIAGMFWVPVYTEEYTDKPHSLENMQAYANLMNGAATGSGGGYGTGSGSNNRSNSGNAYCRRCDGKGEIIKNTYPPQYSGTKDYDKKCYKCNQWFKASLGHCHVTCGSCGGTGRLR